MLACLRCLLLACWLLAAVAAHATLKVVIVSSERSAAYAQAAHALVDALARGGVPRSEVLQLTVLEFAAADALTPALFVALGAQAAQVLAKAAPPAPVLCTLLPRYSFERILLQSGRKASESFSALYLDQPLSRQLALIRLALPQAQRIGVLTGPESQQQAAALQTRAQAQGLELVVDDVGPGESLFPHLQSVLQETDVLLALPDPLVYNSGSIQNILLASFRAKVPLVAFSPAYVRAGALFALHVTPTQIGQQAALLARNVLQGKGLPPTPLYAPDFSVEVNEHVARSLGLALDGDDLRERLRRQEGKP